MAENTENVVSAGNCEQNGGQKPAEKSTLVNGEAKEIQEKVNANEAVCSQVVAEENNQATVDEEKEPKTVEIKEVNGTKPNEILIKEENEIKSVESPINGEIESKPIKAVSEVNKIEKIAEAEVTDEAVESKIEEITVPKGTTIVTINEEPSNVTTTPPKQAFQLERWGTIKSVFFALFIVLFIIWLVVYYANENGYITIFDSKK